MRKICTTEKELTIGALILVVVEFAFIETVFIFRGTVTVAFVAKIISYNRDLRTRILKDGRNLNGDSGYHSGLD